MATRKQRRRREKEMRHEYEIVYLDDEGNEVEPDETEIHAPAKRNSAPAGKKASKAPSASGRRGRAPQPPSWRRVAKRGALFAPVFLVTLLVLPGKHNAATFVQVLVLLVFFIPFSYFLDSFMWRSYQKKTASKR